ncbi:MAG: hypothetical protein PF444_05805 [Bacteroidales bacterium]|nr:hypothetical protein [Bacteroidales bacterium]
MPIIVDVNPDYISINGRGGATGSAPKFVKDNTQWISKCAK